jgi:hypothetical protein
MNDEIINQNVTTHGTKELLISGRKRLCYLIACKQCDVLHYKSEHELLRGIRRNKDFFCSRQCHHDYLSTSVVVSCTTCAKNFERSLGQISKVQGNVFCSRSCAAIYNNSKYPKRNKKVKPPKIKLPKQSKIYKCLICSATIDTKRDYCDDCRPKIVSEKSKKYWEEEYVQYIIKWQNAEIAGSKGEGQVSARIRKYLFEKYGSKCSECGWSKINPITGKIPLEVDHIDGDWNNHREDNLRLLCPSCHSITPTYKSLNNGHGRTNRLLKLQNGGSSRI